MIAPGGVGRRQGLGRVAPGAAGSAAPSSSSDPSRWSQTGHKRPGTRGYRSSGSRTGAPHFKFRNGTQPDVMGPGRTPKEWLLTARFTVRVRAPEPLSEFGIRPDRVRARRRGRELVHGLRCWRFVLTQHCCRRRAIPARPEALRVNRFIPSGGCRIGAPHVVWQPAAWTPCTNVRWAGPMSFTEALGRGPRWSARSYPRIRAGKHPDHPLCVGAALGSSGAAHPWLDSAAIRARPR